MTTNRTPIDRPPRYPTFDPGVLELFRALETTPRGKRGTREYKDRVHELMRALGLVAEFWTMNSPLDRGGPCHPEGYIANEHWRTCREVREQLLEAAASQ